jgi:hypothetical protein
MARIQLRDASVFLQDGFACTATIDDVAGIIDTDVDIDIDPVTDSNSNLGVDIISVGARMTVDAGDGTIYTVTARTPADGLTATSNIVWTPAANAANVAADGTGLTFLPQRLEIKVGEGDISWSETREFIYDRDRDVLDTVRLGQDQPMSVDAAFTFEYITASSGDPATPVDALNQDGEATEWVSSSSDLCEPYAVDVVVRHCVPCGTDEDQEILLPDFRYETLDYSVADASITFNGQCNSTRATVVRSTNVDC